MFANRHIHGGGLLVAGAVAGAAVAPKEEANRFLLHALPRDKSPTCSALTGGASPEPATMASWHINTGEIDRISNRFSKISSRAIDRDSLPLGGRR